MKSQTITVTWWKTQKPVFADYFREGSWDKFVIRSSGSSKPVSLAPRSVLTAHNLKKTINTVPTSKHKFHCRDGTDERRTVIRDEHDAWDKIESDLKYAQLILVELLQKLQAITSENEKWENKKTPLWKFNEARFHSLYMILPVRT